MPFYMNTSYIGLFLLIAIIPVVASMKVQGAFKKYARVRSVSGYTGEETARRILMMNNLNQVTIRPIRGSMTDHYNPLQKEVSLSQTVYGQNTISAISVAAHEVGHAIQDATGYSFLRFRHRLYPVTNIASQLSMPMVILGFITPFTGMVTVGLVLFSITTLFSLVTLPVEINASNRAIAALSSSGILSPEELKGAREVLNAAAFTYVAAAATSILMLLRLILIYGNQDRD
ncbi:MAG: zinc metallopeptidase [Cellulosilyticaceae bacterium]